MKKLLNLLIIFFIFALLAACVASATKNTSAKNASTKQTSNKPIGGVIVAPSLNNDATDLLSFAEAYGNQSADMQKKTLTATNQALVLNPNDMFNRLKLAMIYGLPSSNFVDTVKAQNLLQQVLQENILENAQLFYAHVLFDYCIAMNKLNKNNREDEKRADSLQQKNDALQQKNDALQTKLTAAEQKLVELKNIEKTMGTRDLTPK
jgi:preprotein translocase subunit SecG